MSAPGTTATAARLSPVSTVSRSLLDSLASWWQGSRDLDALDRMSSAGLADVGLMRHEPLPRNPFTFLLAPSSPPLRERRRTGQRRP
ncbi:MAG: hypothetical protein ABWZ57_11180 [Mesorhizobium sp.]|jgi:uncharacterized protein YjiS (DUF1127 family)